MRNFSMIWWPALLLGLTRSLVAGASNDAPGTRYSVRVRVETQKPTHTISPYIYGASAIDPEKARELGVTTVRWGGNRSSRYNWKAQADNAGSDWFFLNAKSGRWSDFVVGNSRAGLSSYVTVPLLPWVAKGPDGWGFSVAKYGPQRKVEPYVADRGDGLRPDGTPLTGNDPRDSSIPSDPLFQAEGIRTLPRVGPPRVYGLDNEIMLWSHTHRDVHSQPVTYDEAFRLGRDYARAIKQADPSGLVAGPCTWGWTDLTYSAADEGKDRYQTHADRKAHGDMPFLPWYLAAMKTASAESGRRLLDLVDVHFYPQGPGIYGNAKTPAARAVRLRSTRALWDPSYKDESWINEPVRLIPRLRGWIEETYPGTKLCLGEYSWGGDDDPSGAVAQAEVLGILARERVDYAYFWAGLGGVQKHAFQLYRNPDGRHHGFGEQFLASRSDEPERLSAFAARRADGALTIVLVNKDLDHPAEVTLELGTKVPASAHVYRLTNPPGPIRHEAYAPKRGAASISLPPLSAALMVFP